MLLAVGDKVHVIARRMFESDGRRHFLGTVDDVDASAIRATGYAYVYDPGSSTFVRRAEPRTRIIALADALLIIHVLPQTADLEAAQYTTDEQNHLVVTDGGDFSLDINEFGPQR